MTDRTDDYLAPAGGPPTGADEWLDKWNELGGMIVGDSRVALQWVRDIQAAARAQALREVADKLDIMMEPQPAEKMEAK